MGQPVTNIGERRPEADQKLAPPEVAVARPHPRRKDWALNALGLAAIFAICYFGEEVLVVLLISVLVAFILAPLADLLIKLHFPRALAAGVAVFVLMAGLGGAAYYGVNQASNLLEQLPKYTGRIRQDVAKLSRKTQNLQALNPAAEKGTVKVRETTSFTDLLSRGFGSATEVLLAASFVPILAFFMLTWQEHARTATVGLFPLEHRREAHTAMGQVGAMVRSFMVGNLVIALVIGAVSTVVFGFLHVPFFYFAGIVSGFISLIPYLGAVLAALPPLFLAVGKLSIADVGWIFFTSIGCHMVAMNVLYPKILGSRLRLNPLAATIALLVWGFLWGALGLLLAVPLTAGMKIVFDHVESLKPYGVWLGEEGNGNGKH
jgi:predicted PurR-regulated permease PerM